MEIIDKEKWKEYSSEFHDHNYRQLWEFSTKIADQWGSKVEHLSFSQNNKIVALAGVRVKMIPFFKTGIAYVSGGPLVWKEGLELSEKNEKILAFVLDELINEYVIKRKLTLRISPSLISDIPWNNQIKKIFFSKKFYVENENFGYRTIVVDISSSLEVIRKNMHSKWRNQLNKAFRQKLVVRSGHDPDLFDIFSELFDEMIERKKFSVNLHPDFYSQVQKKLDYQDAFLVSIAELDGKPVAGHVSSMLGDTCVYLLGASIEEGLKAGASYLLQWHAIEMAKEHGGVDYDLGGVDPDKNPGGYMFKNRMGGTAITVPGPFELQVGGLNRYVVKVSESIYRALKG